MVAAAAVKASCQRRHLDKPHPGCSKFELAVRLEQGEYSRFSSTNLSMYEYCFVASAFPFQSRLVSPKKQPHQWLCAGHSERGQGPYSLEPGRDRERQRKFSMAVILLVASQKCVEGLQYSTSPGRKNHVLKLILIA